MSNNSFQNKFKGQKQIMGKGGISTMGAINEKSKNNMNHHPQNKINMNYNMKSQINKNSENDFSYWKKIYNDEQKIKGKKSEKKMSKIKSGGEMIISNNKNKKQSNELNESNEVEDSEQSKIKSKNTTSSILEVSNINEKLVNSTLKKSSSSSNKTKTYKNNNNEEEDGENEELLKSKQESIKNKKKKDSSIKQSKIDPNEKFNGELKIQVLNVENLTLPKNVKSPYVFNLKLSIDGFDQTARNY